MTLRKVLEKSGQEDRIDDYLPSWKSEYLINAYWELRKFIPELSDPITPGLVNDLRADGSFLLNRQERGIIYQMDAALRNELSEKRAEIDRYMSNRKKS